MNIFFINSKWIFYYVPVLNQDNLWIFRDDQGKVGPFVPALGFILGTILYIQKPLQHNFLQTIASVEMYRSGCNQKVCVISYLYIHVYIFKHDYSRFIFMYMININQNNAQIQIFRWFQKLGWCKGIKGTRTAVDH